MLSVSCTVPLGFVVILIAPPLDWWASVVTELFVIANWLPALIWILPAFPGPVLLAEMLAPLVNVADWPAVMLRSPPVACARRAAHCAGVAAERAAGIDID